MKKISLTVLSLVVFPLHAQSILGSLQAYQDTLRAPQTSKEPTPAAKKEIVIADKEGSSSSSKVCTQDSQTSFPLKYLSSLFLEKDGGLDIVHDPRTGQISLETPEMISNCSSMLEWKLKKPVIEGKKAYAFEVAFKQGDDCSTDGCTYKIAKVKDKEFQKWEEHKFQPNLKGFEACLKESGVIQNGKVVAGSIYPGSVKESYSGIDQTGKLLFLSSGPSSKLTGAKFGKFDYVDGCDHYESHPELKELLTFEDAQKKMLDEEANKLKECKIDDLFKLTDFIEKYEAYADELGEVRDRLLLEAAKKAAIAIAEGKYTEDDLKLVAEFNKYIVEPKVERAIALYEEMLELEGDAKVAKKEELTKLLAELTALNKKPYFDVPHVLKLMHDGKFEAAEEMNTMKLVLENFQRLGAKQDDIIITPGVAQQRVIAARDSFATTISQERERYEVRTGQVTGKSNTYANYSKRMRNNIQIRNESFMAEIQQELARIQQPNGYCYAFWRNTTKCVEESIGRYDAQGNLVVRGRVHELQAILQHFNSIDEERAAEYDRKAAEYAELEAQGRKYIAAQNGEPVQEAPQVASDEPEDTTLRAPQRAQQPGVYTFDFNPGNPSPQQRAQMSPPQYTYPVNPYAINNAFQAPQNPYSPMPQQQWLGQQSYPYSPNYGMQASYGMNWSFNTPTMQYGYQTQQQNNGYWGNPYQAYNYSSIYGPTY